MIQKLARGYSARARARRAEMLRGALAIAPDARVLDLGGGTGGHIASVLPGHRNVTIADVSASDLAQARQRGYDTVQLASSGALPFADGEFDFVFCSSVIEHVTGDKDTAVGDTSQGSFERRAWEAQKLFASEIRRIAKSYYVQTPYRHFIVESHSWLPGVIVYLPRRILVPLLKAVGTVWPKSTSPDWHLLDRAQMRALFPDARILEERSLGMVKSLIAISGDKPA